MSRSRWLAVALGVAAIGLAIVAARVVHHAAPSSPPSPPPTAKTPASARVDAGLVDAGPTLATIAGHVVDEVGQPIADARLTLSAIARAGVSSSARSDAAGGFRLAASAFGEQELVARAAGHLPRALRLAVAAPGDGGVAESTDPITLVMARAGGVAGVVRDASGQPVAGAHVVALAADGTTPLVDGAAAYAASGRHLEPAGELGVLVGPIPYPPPPGSLPEVALAADSDGSGAYLLDSVPPGTVVIAASHAAHADARSPQVTVVAGQRATVDLTLPAALAARGHVVDDRGALAGAELWIGGRLAAVSGGDGRFEVARLAGRVEAELRAAGHVPRTVTLDPAIADEELRLESAAGRITGVVLDERGRPVAGAKLALTGPAHEAHAATSDARGEFRVEGVSGAALSLAVTVPRYPVATIARVAAGDDVRVALVPGGAVAGEVRDADSGAAPRRAEVTLSDGSGARLTARTVDARGRFEIYGAAPGAATLSVEAPGYLPSHQKIHVPGGDRADELTVRDLRVDLALGGAVVGRVTGETGDPAPGVVVSGGGLSARTGSDGRYRLAPLAPGEVDVSVPGASDHVTVAAGREARVDLRLP